MLISMIPLWFVDGMHPHEREGGKYVRIGLLVFSRKRSIDGLRFHIFLVKIKEIGVRVMPEHVLKLPCEC